jgi:ankyrin repeat protein
MCDHPYINEQLINFAGYAEDYLDQFVDCGNADGDTALHFSARKGHLSIVRLLVDRVPELLTELNRAVSE